MNLPQLLNQNSYWFAAFFILAPASLVVLFRFRRSRLAWSAMGLLGALALFGNFFLRGGGGAIESVAQFEQLIAAPPPVVVEFYSNN